MQEIIKLLQDTSANINNTLLLLSTQNNHLQFLTNLLQTQFDNASKADDSASTALDDEQKKIISDIIYTNESINNFTSVLEKRNSHIFLQSSVAVEFSKDGRKFTSVVDTFNNYGREFSSVAATPSNSRSENVFTNDISASATNQIAVEIDLGRIKQYILWEKVKEKLPPKRSRKTLRNVSTILKTLYQNPKQTHHDLMRLTGMTVDGMAKHIQMLKKNKFIHRVGYQQYELTNFALEILRASMG